MPGAIPNIGTQLLDAAFRDYKPRPAIIDSSGLDLGEPQQKETDMTQKTINTALDKVGLIEGGYVNDPRDPGGETNHGVTLKFLQSVRKGATSADLKALTKDAARELFDEHFVKKPGLDKLADVVQAEAIGLAINAGPAQAIRVLQRAAGVKADGVIGSRTIEAVAALTNDKVKEAVDNFYIDLVQKRPDLRVFLKGWLNRSATLNSIPEDVE